MRRLTRRLFVGSAVALGGLATVSVVTCGAEAGRLAWRDYDRLDVVLQDIVASRPVGQAFRAKVGEDGMHQLAARNRCITEALKVACPATRRDMLRAGMRQDFASGKVVLCARFVLSETECIVAGLRSERPAHI